MKFENNGSQETLKKLLFCWETIQFEKGITSATLCFRYDLYVCWYSAHEGYFSMTILKMKGQCDHLKAQAKHALLTNDHEVLVENT